MNTLGLYLFTRMAPFPFQMASSKDCSFLRGQNINCGFKSITSCPSEIKRLTNLG